MGKYFSDTVEKAVADLFYCYDNDRAKRAEAALRLAAEGQGDGDAYYFLSCCCLGASYNWVYHPFEEDEEAAYRLLGKGIALGSAAAVLGALRENMLTPEYRELMPFENIGQARDVILEKAENGCQFCQYLIGNTYYFLDVIEIDGVRESQFADEEAWDNWRREQMEKSLPWFARAFGGGMGLAGRNLCDYYRKGRGCLVAADQDRATDIIEKGAVMRYPEWMYALGNKLFFIPDRKVEGFSWALQAAKLGYAMAWDIVGDGYRQGDVVDGDLPYALECYEKSAACGDDSYACGQAGEMYFLGLGTERDYDKAARYLEKAHQLRGEDDADTAKLGLCCLLGYGCRQDVERGKALLERSEDAGYKNYGLGMMYAQGIGVKKDIARGVEYFQEAGDCELARRELKNYKKGLFGGWRRA